MEIKDLSVRQIRSSPRLSEVRAAALRKQNHLKQQSSLKCESVEDPYGAATEAKDFVGNTTGLVYDVFMTEHYNPWDSEHVEKPLRMTQAFARCEELNLVERCERIPTRFATDEELELVHSKEHLRILQEICELAANPDTLEEAKLRCISNYQGVYMNSKTLDCTRMAAAATIDLVEKIVNGNITNGMALVRPPGHHAMTSEFNGFCLCNNVAIAAKNAVKNLGVNRVLIVDFDAHHGQATQREFYDTSKVLYVSIHRYEHGSFWPNLRESNFDAIGALSTDGHGYNVNFPLNEIGMGDSEYLAMFHQVILPMAYEYSPELVIVSAGFDAAFGCPEGCMRIMPAAYGHIISSLMALAYGKVAVVLEGGYFVPTVAEGSAMCLRALLGDYCLSLGPLHEPKPSSVDTILSVLTMLKNHWTFLRLQDEHPENGESSVNKKIHIPVIEFRGEGLVELLYSKVYDPKLHYFNHSPERLLELIMEFKQIQRLYESNFTSHQTRSTRIAMVYDPLMMRHKNEEDHSHPEQPKRIEKIYECLRAFGLLERSGFEHIPSRRATDEEILLVHDQSHLGFLKTIPHKAQSDLNKMAERLDSIYLNPDTADCALLSAGSLLEVVDAVVMNKAEKGLAVIRPPGHHAEEDESNGFCILNNVAMAVKYALEIHCLKRILVIDWDVHHGNGIQNMFYKDPRVLYISLHRYDNGTFFPAKQDANYDFVGSGPGEGFNINIPWNIAGLGDSEYLLALFNIILPVGYQFDPELVVISSGFDAAWGDPLGKCKLSPEVYGHMTHHLQSLANGKIIVALEGGYNLHSISYSMTMCAKALIGDRLPPIKPKEPMESAKSSIKAVISQHAKYWSCLQFDLSLPDRVSSSLDIVDAKSATPTKKADSTAYIPSQYGTPSSTASINTLTSSRQTPSTGHTSDTKDYYKGHSTSEAIDVQMRRLDSFKGTGECSSMEYLPSEYGQYASSNHTNTLSRSLEKPSPLISTESNKNPTRTDESPSE